MLSLPGAVAASMLLALTVYALLGGADFGGGVWDLLARGPRAAAQRTLIAHALGPVWEANHVWLIVVIVLLFTAFPPAFAAVMTTLHVPLSLMLLGIVVRGSAFTFRSYGPPGLAKERWNRVFSVPSVITPVLLGAIIGAIATGKVEPEAGAALPLFWSWLAPFPLAVGSFTLAIFAFLAAVYLTLETSQAELREDFRRRAIAAGIAVGVLAYLVYYLARWDAVLVFEGLRRTSWGWPVRIATGACAIAALISLYQRWYQAARVTAVLQVTLILWGCALAQYPYLVPPRLTITNCAAPARTLRFLLIALAAGSVILLPSLYYLLRIFKGHTFSERMKDEG